MRASSARPLNWKDEPRPAEDESRQAPPPASSAKDDPYQIEDLPPEPWGLAAEHLPLSREILERRETSEEEEVPPVEYGYGEEVYDA